MDKLVLFGGAGSFNKQLKERHTMGDLRFFSTTDNEWLPESDLFDDGERRNRYSHAATVYGSCLVLHGGYDD